MSLFGIGAPAVAGIASDILGGLFSSHSASKAAEEQMEHQKELMDLQHQYNMYDYQHQQ